MHDWRLADGSLEAAISHWAPRFSTAGVYPVDFNRITAALSSWDEWCRGWSQAAAEHAQLGYQALEQVRTRSAGANVPNLHRPYSADWMAGQLTR